VRSELKKKRALNKGIRGANVKRQIQAVAL